jgi:hypothetical protein
VCDEKACEQGGHSPCWAAEPEKIKIISDTHLMYEISTSFLEQVDLLVKNVFWRFTIFHFNLL